MTKAQTQKLATALKSALVTRDFWYASNMDTDYEKGVKSAINAIAVALIGNDSEEFRKQCGM